MAASPIVVRYDTSEEGEAALRWAVDEGAHTGTPVLLVDVLEWWVSAGVGGLGPAISPDYGARQDAQGRVAEAVAAVRKQHRDLAVSGTVLDGPADDVLVDQSGQASLTVLGTPGSGGLSDLPAGSIGLAVAAHAHCPVVLVRSAEASTDAPAVVVLDGSDCDLLAVEFGFAHAAAHDTGIHLVRTWHPPTAGPHRKDVDLDEQVRAEKTKVNDAVAGWRERYPNVSTAIDLVAGPPVDVLVDVSRGARLLVLGAGGEAGLRELLLGSRLLHRASCPIAVVR